MRLQDQEAAVRANLQLAVELKAQGLSDESTHFYYRAQILRRTALKLHHNWGSWLLSWVLAILSGYGYQLWRIFAVYLVVLISFATVYFALGLPNTPSDSTLTLAGDAFLVSLTAIHGRVFLEQLGQYSLQAWVAAVESVVGIVIEGVFVAMLVQRFFGGR